MRVHEITCTKCRAVLKSKAGVPVGQSLACPKCSHKFKVEAPEEEPDFVDDTEVIEVEEEDVPRKKGPPPPPARKKASRDEDPTEEIKPQKTKKTVRAVRDDEDDEDDEPRPKKKKKKKKHYDDEEQENLFLRLKHKVVVRVITMVILLSILAVAAYLLYEKRKAERDASLEVPAVAVRDALDPPADIG